MKYCSLSSGSGGNCHYIETEKVKILVDAGLSGKKVIESLQKIGVKGEDIDYLLISHEHIDHSKGVGVLSRKFDIPILASPGTWQGMESIIGKIAEKNMLVFKNDVDCEIADLGILPFKVYHDALEPSGFSLFNKNKKIVVITDTGKVDERIKYAIRDADLYLFEANHDERMLAEGSYPLKLKQRIASNHGHLSNNVSGNILKEIIKARGENIILGHLSKENNMPNIAIKTVENIIKDAGVEINKDIKVSYAKEEIVGNVFDLSKLI